MIPVLSCKEAFLLDKINIDTGHLSEKILMDNAGRSLAQFIIEYIENNYENILIFLSPGFFIYPIMN